jgi:hypothetical protein
VDQIDAELGQAAGIAQSLFDAAGGLFVERRGVTGAFALGHGFNIDLGHERSSLADGRIRQIRPRNLCAPRAADL